VRSTFLRLLLAIFAVALSGCASLEVGRTAEGAQIVRVPLRLSNAYLVKSRTPILIDSGTAGDLPDLDKTLAEHGVRTTHLGLVVLTHAHADHAGLAAELQRIYGAKVAIGQGDFVRSLAGVNDELRPTSFTATLLKPFIPNVFPELQADIVVNEPVDLAPWGVAGKVISMPGHTAGSVVVVLGNKTAFVGDMMAGGALGGMFFAHDPTEHYYHADREANLRNIKKMIAMGIETFYLGHGGPVSRADVIAAFP
jgi:hydroxyacylglutathione hydrolase